MRRTLLLAGLLLAAPSLAWLQAAAEGVTTALVSPVDGDRIPREGVDICLQDDRYCSLAPVVGRVSQGYWPFLAVRPIGSSPRFWIQGRIEQVAPDRSFEGEASLGANENGAGEYFDIFVIAHRDPARFGAFDILEDVPPECSPATLATPHPICIVSAPVTIFRTR
jgi:hypothetical protein